MSVSPSSSVDAAVARRRLRLKLKQARVGAGLSQRDVAQALEWSTTKIIRIETGSVSVSITDLRALLETYGITDQGEQRHLSELSRLGRRQPFSEYRGLVRPETLQYFGHEAAAQRIRHFEPILVPGLLQIEEYARAILRDVFDYSRRDTDRLIAVREDRKEIFQREAQPDMLFVTSEAVVQYQVGGPSVMRRQMEYILELIESGRIAFQILPFSAGANIGMRGSFIHLELPDNDDDILYLEDMRGDTLERFQDNPEATEPYLQAFLDLEASALSVEATVEYMHRHAEKLANMSSGPQGRNGKGGTARAADSNGLASNI